MPLDCGNTEPRHCTWDGRLYGLSAADGSIRQLVPGMPDTPVSVARLLAIEPGTDLQSPVPRTGTQ